MIWTQAELNALEASYKTGVKSLEYNGRKHEFRTLQEMREILNDAHRELSNKKREPYKSSSYNRGYQ